ncbi:Hypothetical protein POVR2_LOCUS39 [uncultured virus]|nr:Hypothetical protein POVR2_LOCUS39 [uncultured virus]
MIEQDEENYQLAADAVLSGYSASNAIEAVFISLLYPRTVAPRDIVSEMKANNASQDEIDEATILMRRYHIGQLDMQVLRDSMYPIAPRRLEASIVAESTERSFIPFSFLSQIRLVSLPEELLNEPYVNKENARRVLKHYTRRPYFLFYMCYLHSSQHSRNTVRKHFITYCWVGNTYFQKQGQYNRQHGREPRYTTQVSILDIYDLYGLEITYSFLHRIFNVLPKNRGYDGYDSYEEWEPLMLYLAGSLALIRPEFVKSNISWSRSKETASLFCTYLLAELVSLDNTQPRLVQPLQESSILPHDILARIIQDERVSKSISRTLQFRKCTDPLREGEINSVVSRQSTWLIEGKYLLQDKLQNEDILVRQMTVEGNVYRLYHQVVDEKIVLNEEDKLLTHSVYDYIMAYELRGCNGKQAVHKMLRDLLELTVDSSNYETACAWIIQLLYDLNISSEEDVYGYSELQEALRYLVNRTLAVLSD